MKYTMKYSSICTQDCHMQHLINVVFNLPSKLCMFYRDALFNHRIDLEKDILFLNLLIMWVPINW